MGMAALDDGAMSVEDYLVATSYEGASDVTFGDAQWSASVTAAVGALRETGTTTSMRGEVN